MIRVPTEDGRRAAAAAAAADSSWGFFYGGALAVTAVQASVPGVAFATTNRIALALLAVGVALRAARGPAPLGMPRGTLALIGGIAFAISWGILSMLVSPYPADVSPIYLLSWALMGGLTTLGAILANDFNRRGVDALLNVLVLAAATATIATLAYVLDYVGLGGFQDPHRVRGLLIQLGLQLNRHMTGLLTLNCVCMSVLLGVVRRGPILHVVASVSLGALLALVILSGSRQTLVGAAAYAPLVWLLSPSAGGRGSFLGRLSTLVRLGIAAAALLFALYALREHLGFDVGTWFERRFVEKTIDQYDPADGRVDILRTALVTTAENPLFGIGPGAFLGLFGRLPHNGHARVASELGVPALAAIWIPLLAAFGFVPRRRREAQRNGAADLYATSLAFCIVYFLVSNLFNDLLNDYPLWGHAVLVLACAQHRAGSGALMPTARSYRRGS